jgi:hypothetical protein
MNSLWKVLLNVASLAALWVAVKVMAQVPSAIAVQDSTVIATLHAEGAHIYQCKADSDSKSPSQFRALRWQFREPIATLIVDGKSIGRHTAGPNWDHVDGSGVRGQGGFQRARRNAERHSLARDRRRRPSRPRHSVRCDDRPAHQHQRRRRPRILRNAQAVTSACPILRTTCFSAGAGEITPASERGAGMSCKPTR